jgi:catechol 2,3-dioxygenase-like lactoylglutathione lyase family enzyme
MLESKDAAVVLAVSDLEKSRRFYEDILGLKPIGGMGEELITYQSGSTMVNIYRSEYAGSNKATAAAWSVGDDLDQIVRDLRTKGVKFEHYDLPGTNVVDDIHVMGDMKVVWFKDPDGNLLNLINQ